MKYDATTNYKKGEIAGEKTQFNIDPNDTVLMQRLSADTYSYPIKAIVRELGTNAYDSHKEAGQTRPFEVTLPTELDLTFAVQDYGTGLSKDSLTTILTQYGKSTRRNDNDSIGSIGIGAKSPFAYATMFNIETVKDGVLVKALAAKNEYGVPELTILSEQETDAPNSCRFSMPIKLKDIQAFKAEAQDVYQWFTQRPKFNVAVDFKDLNSQKTLASGTGWRLTKGSTSGCLMGNVLYPIDYNQIKAPAVPGLIIEANIGDVAISINRESLHYVNKTLNYLSSAFKTVKSEITEEIQKEIDKQGNKIQALAFKEGLNAHVSKLINKLYFKGSLVHYDQGGYANPYNIRYISEYDKHAMKYRRFVWDDTKFFAADIKQGKIKGAEAYLQQTQENFVYLVEEHEKFEQDFHITLPKISQYYTKAKVSRAKTGNYRASVLTLDVTKNGIPTNANSLYWKSGTIVKSAAKHSNVYVNIDQYKLKNTRFNNASDIVSAFQTYGITETLFGVKNKEIADWQNDITCIHIDKFMAAQVRKLQSAKDAILSGYLEDAIDWQTEYIIDNIYDKSLILDPSTEKTVLGRASQGGLTYNTWNMLINLMPDVEKRLLKSKCTKIEQGIQNKIANNPKIRFIYRYSIYDHKDQKVLFS